MKKKYLLEECEKLVRSATCWDDVFDDLKYAFHTEEEISKAVDLLNVIADSFRNSDKKSYDVYRLVLAIQAAPWPVQEKLLKEEKNADLIEYVKDASIKDLERRVFEDRVVAGEELFKKTGLYASVQEIDEANLKLETAQENYSALIRNVAKMSDKDFDEQAVQLESQIAGYSDKVKEIEKKFADSLPEIRENLLQYSTISYEEAVQWVNNNVTFETSSINKTLTEWKNEHVWDHVPTLEEVKEELVKIYRLTNGGLKNINIKGLKRSGDRACAERKGNIIRWDGNIDTLYHEAGHLFEYANQQHLAIAKHFIEDRATGDPKKLSELTGDNRYRNYEIAYPDTFSHPYVGKIYDDSTEVLSMGLHTLGKKDMLLSNIKDIEHLEFCFGCFVSDASKDIEAYNINAVIKDTGNSRKVDAWIDAIDKAMPGSFAEDLCTKKGVANLKIEDRQESIGKYNGAPYKIPVKILKYGRKIIAREYDSEDALKKLARVAYLAICNFKELIPDADPLISGKTLTNLSRIPPNWFTPLTKLPRL